MTCIHCRDEIRRDVFDEFVHIPGNRYTCKGLQTVAEARPKKEEMEDVRSQWARWYPTVKSK